MWMTALIGEDYQTIDLTVLKFRRRCSWISGAIKLTQKSLSKEYLLCTLNLNLSQ